MSLIQILKSIEKVTIDNSPLILTVLGVTGTVATAVFTGKATYQAVRVLEDKHRVPIEEIPLNKEELRSIWPLYIQPVATGVITVTCIIAAHRIGARRAAALAAAYSISERAFGEYRDKIVEKLGKGKEQAARDELAQDRLNANPITNSQVIITGNGDSDCYDTYSGRYFKSSMQKIQSAVNGINFQINHHMYASLNDFYNRLDLPNLPIGEDVGWRDSLIDIRYSTNMTDEEKPCIVIDFTVSPVRGFFRTH